MKITVMYGTESGNAELIADDLADSVGDDAVEVIDLKDVDPATLHPGTLYLVVCSTHGEGELPESAQPFADLLDRDRPDLTGVRYAMFGLGDRTYEHYSRGSERIAERLDTLGARRVGEYGRHDAASRSSASAVAIAWAEGVIAGEREP